MAVTIKLSEKNQKPFKFELDGKSLVTMIDKITAVSGFISSSGTMRRHMFVSYKKHLYLVGYSTDTFIAIDSGARTDAEGGFNFDADKLKGLVKNRGALKFAYTGTELRIMGGKYKAMIKPSPITIDQIPQVNEFFGREEDKSEALGGELLARLKTGISKTQIYDHFNENAPSPITVVFGSEKRKVTGGKSKSVNVLKVVTQTHWAGSMYEAMIKESHKPFKMVLSSQVFSLVSKVIGDSEEGAHFYFQAEGFKVQTNDTIIGLPPMQEAETNQLEVFEDLLKGLDQSNVANKMTFNVSDAVDTMQNVMVLALKNDMQMSITAKGNDCYFGISNDEGSVKNSIALESSDSDVSVMCFPRVIQDAMNNVKSGDVEMTIYADENDNPNVAGFVSKSKGERLRQFAGLLND